jgi:hypothetical protein
MKLDPPPLLGTVSRRATAAGWLASLYERRGRRADFVCPASVRHGRAWPPRTGATPSCSLLAELYRHGLGGPGLTSSRHESTAQ